MTWVMSILSVWLSWVLVEPAVYISRGIGRCRATFASAVDKDEPSAVYRCKFKAGHSGKHRADGGPIW